MRHDHRPTKNPHPESSYCTIKDKDIRAVYYELVKGKREKEPRRQS